MHLQWKRPDGYVSAAPSDYEMYNLVNKFNIWLHRKDKDWYPFQISGGWQDSALTQRLNHLVNLLPGTQEEFTSYLKKLYNDTPPENPSQFISQLHDWFGALRRSLKGDNWEKEIMEQVLIELDQRVTQALAHFE